MNRENQPREDPRYQKSGLSQPPWIIAGLLGQKTSPKIADIPRKKKSSTKRELLS